jgi:PAS domain-containing protein
LSRSIWPDGTVRWLSGAGRFLLGEHGEPVRGVGISQDVTGRMLADEARARLAAIVDSTDDAIFSTTLDDTILTWNVGAERLYGYMSEEIRLQRMRVFKATIRTVQDIVNNLLNGFQFVRLEGEGHLPSELLTLVDQLVQEAGVKLKTLGDHGA